MKTEVRVLLHKSLKAPWEAPVVTCVEEARRWAEDLGRMTVADPSNIDDVLQFILHQIRRAPLEGVTMMRRYGLTCQLSKYIDPLSHQGMQMVTKEFMKHLDVEGLLEAVNEVQDIPEISKKVRKSNPTGGRKVAKVSE